MLFCLGPLYHRIRESKKRKLISVINSPAKPDVTLTISDSDLVDMMSGKLNSQKAFFQGKLKVTVRDPEGRVHLIFICFVID